MTLHAIWLMVSLVLSLAVAMTIAHVHVSWQMIDRIMHTLSLIMRL